MEGRWILIFLTVVFFITGAILLVYNFTISGKELLKDSDGDSILNNKDNCPYVYNPDQKDSNDNRIGDACDSNTFCISDQAKLDECKSLGHSSVEDSTCPSWSKFASKRCIKYSYNFTCSVNESQLCGTTAPEYMPILTSRCATGWACPFYNTEYENNQSCIELGGIPEPDPLCLLGTACSLYQTANLRCSSG